jgi:hypothetical protein
MIGVALIINRVERFGPVNELTFVLAAWPRRADREADRRELLVVLRLSLAAEIAKPKDVLSSDEKV